MNQFVDHYTNYSCELKLLIVTMLIVGTLNTPLYAVTLPTGDSIALKINARDEGVAVSRRVKMILTDRRGKQRIRETMGFRKYFGKEKRSVIFYLTPRNVKDTGFLTYDYPQTKRADDQWLYLPALRKIRRISASNRGDYFLGTDLTYEDIKLESRVSIVDYTRKTVGKTVVDGRECYKVVATPINKKVAKELGYSKVEQCIDSKIWMVRQSKIWDVRGNFLKTIKVSGIRKVQGIWTSHRLEVKNHKTGHNTLFIFSKVKYGKISDDVFSRRTLKRGL